MNKIIFLALISISMLIFSCETDSDIGKNILPKEDILNLNIVDTTSIKVYTQTMDTIRTNGIQTFLLGEYTDPIFGHAKASFVCEYDKVEGSKFTTEHIIDSAVLYLIADTFNLNHIGNYNITQEIKVYELSDSLDASPYYNDTDPTPFLSGNIIGQKDFLPEVINDTIQDSIVVVKLTDAFAQKFMQLKEKTVNDSIWKIFRGIYITSETGTNDGAIFRYKIDSESLIKIFSHKEDESDVFKITANLAKNTRFNIFEQDYSSTTFFSNINNEDVEQDSVAYIQAMGGLRTKISLPYIENLKSLGDIAINRAELIVNTAPTSVTFETDFSPIERMVLTGYSPDDVYYYLPEYISSIGYRNIAYSDGSYSFDIAGYIRDILDGSVDNNGLLLFASGNTSMKRSVITTGKHSNRMKLVISYTKL